MSTPAFKLTVDGLELTLVEFDGVEEMNRLFKYTFTTEIPTTGEKLADVINGDAIFTIKEFDTSLHSGDIEIPGYISVASKANELWELEFLPKLHKTTTNSRAEIYFREDSSLTALSVIEEEFQNDILLNDRTPVFDITSTLPTRKLFCQLHESNWNFVARMCDHWGFHFYFDHHNQQIVFADNNQYDQSFSTQLKTTSATAENSPLKIANWNESLQAATSMTVITGYDNYNAATPITASYPSSNPGNLTEARQTLADVNSQIEADYIAQIIQEANNCKNHVATGDVKLPYLSPGFLINTDDSDFASALVIKTTTQARNLNSANTATSASFTCSFEAIPDTVLFRPAKHYQIPTATNVYGKIISETNDLTLAQRNQSGEYKVDLLGFENESSVHPWLRKTQTTAGGNSVDIPLLPDTEVLIAFVDDNPNCPYILNAADNSLHPAPVTNANPHHAVVKTGGMLVTSSLEGRHNVAITSKTLEVDCKYASSDADISSSVKNYLTERGKFDQHNNFIDPSSTTAVTFSDSDESSGDYIFTRFSGDSVEIRQGDKMHWHNGNLYDFGGYWNYNLGNSYEENFIDQEAPLNIKVNKDSRTGDILESNGPEWGAIDFDTIAKNGLSSTDVTPTSYGNTAIDTDRSGKTFKVNTGGSWNSGGMNVTKDYNASYDYKFGEGIEVSDRVNSLEITHTDGDTTAIEMNFHKGVLRSWEKSIGRNSEEKKWNGDGNKTFEGSSNFDSTTTTKTEKETAWDLKGDTKVSDSKTITTADSITTDEKTFNMDTGALSTHNIKTTNGMATAEMDFSFDATAASNFNFGASTSFSLSAQADASIAISLSGSAAINIGFGASVEIKTGAEATLELDLRTGVSAEINSKGSIEASGIGFRARAETLAEAEQKTLKMQALITELDKTAMKLASTDVKLMNTTLQLKAGLELTGL